MTRRRLAYFALVLASLGLAACSNSITGPEQQPQLSAECKAVVNGGSTRC
jgi:hypothetical protein